MKSQNDYLVLSPAIRNLKCPILVMTCAPKFPPFSGRVFINEGDYYEAIPFQRRTDYCNIKRAGERPADEGCVP